MHYCLASSYLSALKPQHYCLASSYLSALKPQYYCLASSYLPALKPQHYYLASSYLSALKPQYYTQHPVLKHPQFQFSPTGKVANFTSIKKKLNLKILILKIKGASTEEGKLK